ncbi:unnamed protein product [Mesocestoides corti]|uniref:Uncharacterized protein n=1 Tax=Mesocestoides corti TaxID=53468 RepID=A0A0R3U6G7_MESCO|nr:unnamed protein product [Mesocestoides corti]
MASGDQQMYPCIGEDDHGYFEASSSDEEESSRCWPPPGRRKRHPAGSGLTYIPPFRTQYSLPVHQPGESTTKEVSAAPSEASITFAEPPRSDPVPIPSAPRSSAATSGFCSPQSLTSFAETEPLGAYLMWRFLSEEDEPPVSRGD